MEGESEIRRRLRRRHRQRIEARGQVAARAIGGDELADGRLLARAFLVQPAAARLFRDDGRALHLRHDRRVRNIACFTALEAVEIGFPFRTDAVGIGQILFVQVFDEAGVAAGKLGGLRKLLDQAIHGVRSGPSRLQAKSLFGLEFGGLPVGAGQGR